MAINSQEAWHREAARSLDAKQLELKRARRALVWFARYNGSGVLIPKYVQAEVDRCDG